MEKRELTCIGCPLGCSITVTLENGEIKDVTGYTCKRGHDYARKEVTNPTRIVTSTVRLTGSATGAAVVSCKTAQDIPKGKIFEIVVALRQVTAHAPVKIGDVLLSNAAGTVFEIVEALSLMRLFPGTVQGGEQHRREDRDDSNND